jgi:hypothetical protein
MCIECGFVWGKVLKNCSLCGIKTIDYGFGDGLCSMCRMEKNMKYKATGKFLQAGKTSPTTGKPFLIMKPESTMKNGDVRPLPQSNSPMWTTQWAVQGTAKAPYVVSKRTSIGDQSTTDQGWACSCPNFTQHTPRTECKHILKVMLGEGVKPTGPPVANMSDEQQAAFQKFLRQQAEAGTPALPAGKAKPLFTTGRKFR